MCVLSLQVIQRRSEAYGHAHHARGTHFSRERLDDMNREQAERESSRSESQRSLSPAEERSRDRRGQAPSRTRSVSPPRRREAWTEVRSRSPRGAGSGTEATSDDEDMVLERGRSPTPELRDARHSRRHHLDVTTNLLNDSFEKSLSLSKEKKPSPSRTYSKAGHKGHDAPPREEKDFRPSSPASSVGLGDDARSYTPPRRPIPRKVEISPPDRPRVSPPVSVGGSEGRRDDDVLSVSAMSSRASTASETLERAKKRRDEFWKRENTPIGKKP